MRCPDDFWHSCPLNKSNVHIAEQPNSHKISCGHQACAKHFEIWVEGNSGIMLGWHHVQISLVSFLQTARKGRPASNVAKYDEKSKKEKNITNVWQKPAKTCKNPQSYHENYEPTPSLLQRCDPTRHYRSAGQKPRFLAGVRLGRQFPEICCCYQVWLHVVMKCYEDPPSNFRGDVVTPGL